MATGWIYDWAPRFAGDGAPRARGGLARRKARPPLWAAIALGAFGLVACRPEASLADEPAVARDESAPATGDGATGVKSNPPSAAATGGLPPNIDGLAVVAAIESALQNAIATAEKSVVAIARVKRPEREEPPFDRHIDPFGRQLQPTAPSPGDPDFIPNDFGAGVVVDRDGLILTHYHVLGEVNRNDYYVSTAAHRVYKARVKSADPRSDLAVLSVDAHDLTPIKMGDGGAVKKGQIVIALGNPYAIARDGQVSASWGIVANLSRKSPPTSRDDLRKAGEVTLHQYGTLIQTDAKLNLGSSGGALVDLKGEMIGLLTATAAVAGYEQPAGYAVPTDETFRRVIETLKQGREAEYGLLGITPGNLRSDAILAGKRGMQIAQVKPGGPASQAGLAMGDVITHINGQPIYDADGLVLQVGKQPPDTVVALTFERDERVRKVNVPLAKFPVKGKIITTSAPPSWRGLTVDYSTAKELYQNDLVVTAVTQDSPAWAAGVRPEMHIRDVAGAPVNSPKQFHALVGARSGPVRLTVNDGLYDRQMTVGAGE